MEAFILVVVLQGFGAFSQEFSTKSTCEDAKAAITFKAAVPTGAMHGALTPVKAPPAGLVECFPKGLSKSSIGVSPSFFSRIEKCDGVDKAVVKCKTYYVR